jgi:hypothetical protein
MKSTQLKIKIKSLASEQEIIRQEEGKLKRTIRSIRSWQQTNDPVPQEEALQSITHHRKIEVRRHLRYAHLCYAYMRGMPYKAVESRTRTGNEPVKSLVIAEVGRFVGKHVKAEEIERWLSEAKEEHPSQEAA